MELKGLTEKIDASIRVFLYILIFWLPYSSAVVEICVIISLILWLAKRTLIALYHDRAGNASILEKIRFYARNFKPASSPLNRPIGIFIIVCLLSVLSSAFSGQSFHNFLTKTLEWFIVYFLVIEAFKTRLQINTIFVILAITGVAVILDSILQYHVIHKDIFSGNAINPGDRASGPFKTPNGLGAYLAFLIPLLVGLALYVRKSIVLKGLAIAMITLAIWSLVITFSRGAWVGALLGLSFFALIPYFKRNRANIYFVAGGLCLACVLFFGLLGKSDLRASVFNGLSQHRNVQWRLNLWNSSLHMIRDRPLLGHGINTYMKVYQHYRNDTHGKPTYAHNCYLQLAAETGLLGLAAFIWIIINIMRTFNSNYCHYAKSGYFLESLACGLMAGILAFLAHSFFDTQMYSLQLSAYFWFMVGVYMALNRIAVKDAPAQQYA